MSEASRIGILVGLLFVGGNALFPPRIAYRHYSTPYGDSWELIAAPRRFLFSGKLHREIFPFGAQEGSGVSARIDAGRLLAQTLLIACVCGFLIVWWEWRRR